MKNLLILPIVLLLSSCFDVREEVWVEANGNAMAVLDYDVPSEGLILMGGEEGMRERITAIFDELPKLELRELSITRDGSRTRMHMVVWTRSVLAFQKIKETTAFQDLPAASKDFSGSYDVVVSGLEVDVSRKVDIAKALGFAALAVNAEDRQNRRIQYIMHLPKAAIEHNADRVEGSGRTLIWDRTLGSALDGPIVTRFKAPIPLPWWIIAGGVTVVALVTYGIHRLVRRLRSRRSAA